MRKIELDRLACIHSRLIVYLLVPLQLCILSSCGLAEYNITSSDIWQEINTSDIQLLAINDGALYLDILGIKVVTDKNTRLRVQLMDMLDETTDENVPIIQNAWRVRCCNAYLFETNNGVMLKGWGKKRCREETVSDTGTRMENRDILLGSE